MTRLSDDDPYFLPLGVAYEDLTPFWELVYCHGFGNQSFELTQAEFKLGDEDLMDPKTFAQYLSYACESGVLRRAEGEAFAAPVGEDESVLAGDDKPGDGPGVGPRPGLRRGGGPPGFPPRPFEKVLRQGRLRRYPEAADRKGDAHRRQDQADGAGLQPHRPDTRPGRARLNHQRTSAASRLNSPKTR